MRTLVNSAYERTLLLLTEKKVLAGELAALLLEKEVIHREDVEAVLGARLWKEATTYEELRLGIGNSSPETAAPEMAMEATPAAAAAATPEAATKAT